MSNGGFWRAFIDSSRELMSLPPTPHAERDINVGPFKHTAAKLAMVEDPFFGRLKLRLDSSEFAHRDFSSTAGLNMHGSASLDSICTAIVLSSPPLGRYVKSRCFYASKRPLIE